MVSQAPDRDGRPAIGEQLDLGKPIGKILSYLVMPCESLFSSVSFGAASYFAPVDRLVRVALGVSL